MTPVFFARCLLRESRGARKRFLFFIACLAVGVAAIVSVAGLSSALSQSMRSEARKLLAADLTVSSSLPLPETLRSYFAERPQLQTSRVRELVTMVAISGTENLPGRSQLVELKVVEEGYPYYGSLVTEPDLPLDQLLTEKQILVAPDLLPRLDLEAGDELRIGGRPFRIRGVLLSEPDQSSGPFSLGPRVLINSPAFDSTELEQRGSRIFYRLLIQLPQGYSLQELNAYAEELRELLGDDSGFRVRTYVDAQENLQQAIRRVEQFLGLVALLSLLLGGLGVAQTTSAWLASRIDAIAIYRCLGLKPGEVLTLYLGHATALGLVGSVLGSAAGIAIQALVVSALGDLLPVAQLRLWQPAALLRGLALGVGVALLFTLAPLLEVRRVPPLRVLRKDVEPPPRSRWGHLMFGLLLVSGIWLLAGLQARSLLLGGQFTVGVLAAATLLFLAALAVVRSLGPLASRLRPVWLRHGIAGLAQPGAPTLGATVALGLGVLLVLGLGLVDRGVTEELRADLPSAAPTAFFIDIQPPQWSGVQSLLEEAGATQTDSVPVVTARLRAIDGKMVSELTDASSESRSQRWALTREQRLTYLDRLPNDNRLLAGELWSDPQRDELSIEQEFAGDLGVDLGSELTFDVQGVPIELTVTSIRKVDWRTFGINFFLVVEPGVLDRAPQQRVAASRLPEQSEQAIQDRLAAEYPNVTMLRIRDLLEKIAAVLDRLATGVRLLGTFSVLAGILILAGGVSAGTVRRSRQIALFKTLGMTRTEIVAMLTAEYALIGAVAGSIGSTGGELLSWAVLTRGMELQWSPHPELLVLAILLSIVLTAATGVTASWEALRRRPLEVLRSD